MTAELKYYQFNIYYNMYLDKNYSYLVNISFGT